MKPAGSRPAGRRNTVQYLQTGGGCKVEMEEHPQDKGKESRKYIEVVKISKRNVVIDRFFLMFMWLQIRSHILRRRHIVPMYFQLKVWQTNMMIGSRRDFQPLTLPHLRMFFMDFPTKSGISFPLPLQVSQTRPNLWRRMREILSVHTSNCCPLSGRVGPTGTDWDVNPAPGVNHSQQEHPPLGKPSSTFWFVKNTYFSHPMKYWLINRYTGIPYTYYWTIILPNKIQ